MAQQTSSRVGLLLKLLLVVGAVTVFIIAIDQLNLHQLFQNALGQVKELGPAGAIAFIALYGLAAVLLIPGSILTLGGGALFGVTWGSVYVFAGAFTGATLAFLVGRYFVRNWVFQQIAGNPKFKAIDEAVAREGARIVLLTRLAPIFPYNLLNYAYGITQVSLKDYLLGSIGMLPSTVMYVYLGSLAGNLATIGTGPSADPKTQQVQWIIQIVGLIVTIGVTVYVTRVAQKALKDSYEF